MNVSRPKIEGGQNGQVHTPKSDVIKTKCPKQLTAKVFSYPSGLNVSSGGNATPAFPMMMSNLPRGLPVSSVFFLKASADVLALWIVERSSSWKCTEPVDRVE
jgi:hypothetical protein